MMKARRSANRVATVHVARVRRGPPRDGHIADATTITPSALRRDGRGY